MLAINLATRGRPQLLAETVSRTVANIRRPDTVLMLSIDDDDAPTRAVVDQYVASGVWGERVRVCAAPREDTIAAKWNRVLGAYPRAAVYMPMCDDRPVVTEGFDERVLAAAEVWPDGIGVVFNHLDNLSFTSVQAVTRRLAELMGGVIYVEHFPYWFVDHWLSDLAEMIDRVAFADVRLAYDVCPPTQEMREPGWWATFYDACKVKRHATARAILTRPEFKTPNWLKTALNLRFDLIDEYSKIINDGVRAMKVADAPQDERYLRVKRAAQELLRTEILPGLEAAA